MIMFVNNTILVQYIILLVNLINETTYIDDENE